MRGKAKTGPLTQRPGLTKEESRTIWALGRSGATALHRGRDQVGVSDFALAEMHGVFGVEDLEKVLAALRAVERRVREEG